MEISNKEKESGRKKMKFKEKIQLYFKIEEQLIEKQQQLETADSELLIKEAKLEDVSSELKEKEEELKSLKNEVLELKDFINSKFNSEFCKNYDYALDIRNCYIISFQGKKYITIRMKKFKRTNLFDYISRCYNYLDALSVINKRQFRYICGYTQDVYSERCYGEKPDYEEHILNLYPELKMYEDGLVPNTHLKKIYFEINNLGNLSTNDEKNEVPTQKVKK